MFERRGARILFQCIPPEKKKTLANEYYNSN